MSNLSAYMECRKGNRQGFWHNLYATWWQRYPWKLEDDKEPPTNDPDEMARLASVVPGEEGSKAAVKQRLTKVRWIFIHCG